MSQYPELYPQLLPFTQDEMETTRVSNPLLYFDTLRLRQLANTVAGYQTITEVDGFFNELVNRHFGSNGINNGLAVFNQALEMAQRELKNCIRVMPNQIQPKFTSEGKVAFSEDFQLLLTFWSEIELKARNGEPLARLREFEARRLIWLGIHCAKTLIKRSGASKQQDPGSSITDQLEKFFFTNGDLVPKRIISWHDPNNEERVSFWHFAEEEPTNDTNGLIKKITDLDCRTTIVDGQKKLSFFDSRKKDWQDEVRKGISVNILSSNLATLDQYGLRFVFFDRQDLELCVNKLFQDVWPLPYTTWKMSDNIAGEYTGIARNCNSNKHFRALKFQTLTYGHWPEIMVQSLEDYINYFRSRGPETHEYYRAEQRLKKELVVCFPEEIYGVNLTDPEIRDGIFRRALAAVD